MKTEKEIRALLEQDYRLLEELNIVERHTGGRSTIKEFVRGLIFAYQLILRDDSANIDEKIKIDINLK